jgi:hypothetical protein
LILDCEFQGGFFDLGVGLEAVVDENFACFCRQILVTCFEWREMVKYKGCNSKGGAPG